MENILTLKWRSIYIAYGLIILSIVMLFFTERFNGQFMDWMQWIGLSDMISGLSLQKLVLFILDISLFSIVLTPLANEDERVEKIRSVINRNMFGLTILTVAFLGLMVSPEFNMLVLVAFILVNYLFMFHLCLYLDPRFIYMNSEEVLEYTQKTMKRVNIYTNILIGVCIMIAMPIAKSFHSWNLFWEICITIGYLIGMIRTVYYSWKG